MDPMASNARIPANRNVRRAAPSFMKYLLPVTCLFAIAGIGYTFKWNEDRKKAGVCISCQHQKEMMEEVYGDKKVVHKVNRF